jgi:hypothetical protein
MRKFWDIPNESNFYCTGKDWLQNILYKLNKRQRSQTLMLLWRCWHLRNGISIRGRAATHDLDRTVETLGMQGYTNWLDS